MSNDGLFQFLIKASVPRTTVADELKENLEAVDNFKGSPLEKQAMLYCKHLGINYKIYRKKNFVG